MPFLTTRDKTDLYYKDWGNGRPVILIHGWPLNADSWDGQALPIAEAGYRVIAYDRRGFGRSAQPWTGYDYDTLADDLADVIAATGATDVTIIGFSMGGGEVARYMSRHKGKGVVQAGLVGSVVPFLLQTPDHPNGAPIDAFEGMKAGIRADRHGFIRNFLLAFFGVGTDTTQLSPATTDAAFAMTIQASLKGMVDCITAFGTTDFRPDLAAFTVPTLIVHGTGDVIVPIETTARAVAAVVPGATLIEYDGAPHGLQETHRQRLADDIIAFLARAELSGGQEKTVADKGDSATTALLASIV
jgi:non-heme chloroperoxidase